MDSHPYDIERHNTTRHDSLHGTFMMFVCECKFQLGGGCLFKCCKYAHFFQIQYNINF
jgi:hypothetical protein